MCSSTHTHTARTTYAANGFCDHNRTRSSIDGNYSWEESTAGVAVTQACVFGTDVDGGKARRECGADARWREPDFTQCIDSKSSIDIASFPGPIQLSAADGGLGMRLPLTYMAVI